MIVFALRSRCSDLIRQPTSGCHLPQHASLGKALPYGFDYVRRVILSVAKRNRTRSAPSNAKVESRRTPLRMTQECRSRCSASPYGFDYGLRPPLRMTQKCKGTYRTSKAYIENFARNLYRQVLPPSHLRSKYIECEAHIERRSGVYRKFREKFISTSVRSVSF